ncbi:DUF192 domain-containing protein, partial [Haladaptatus sp.]|uniref:DUF192 domain-containing protein n=1 Tax=Haladaptatus sp. TaxID=1973141 RepID=UPI003C4C8204
SGTMHVVHRRDGEERTLVAHVEPVDSLRSRVGGLARLAVRDDYGLVFEFGSVGDRRASTVATPLALDVVWTENGEVTNVARLPRWTGTARGTGDRVFEFSGGVVQNVRLGDELVTSQAQSSRSTE